MLPITNRTPFEMNGKQQPSNQNTRSEKVQPQYKWNNATQKDTRRRKLNVFNYKSLRAFLSFPYVMSGGSKVGVRKART